MSERHEYKAFKGYIRKDCFGRFYVDNCESDEKHLTAPAIPGKERNGCRLYLDDLFSDFDGQYGYLLIQLSFEPKNEPNT